MRKIDVYPEASTFIQQLPLKHQKQIVAKIDVLAAGNEAGTKALVQFPPCRRMRSGDYRIVYVLTESTLTIVSIGVRSTVYRDLKRKYKPQ